MPSVAHGDEWPALGHESVDWTPGLPADLLTRAQRQRYRGAYRAAVVPLIVDRSPALPNDVSTLASEATLALTRFDAELGHDIAPFASILLRSESAASSQIENLSSGAKQIALAELGSRQKQNATAIVGNVAAMTAAIELADRLDGEAILAMHRALMQTPHHEIAGRWRTEQVWIGGSSIGPHDADFVAPVAARVPGLIDDLIAFTHRTDLPPLVISAIAHAQFETIHPFPDGNGRTGRALLQSMLRGYGITRNTTIPVSAGLLSDTDSYFSALNAYRRGDAARIVERISYAALRGVDDGRQLVTELRRIRAEWDDQLHVRRGSAAHRLLDVVLRRPVIDSKEAAAQLGISTDNVNRAIRPLADAGILHEFTGFDRNRMWQAVEVTDALDSFAARTARRR